MRLLAKCIRPCWPGRRKQLKTRGCAACQHVHGLSLHTCTHAITLCLQVGIEKEKVNAENAAAQVEADACAAIAAKVAELQARCEGELAAAEPLVAQAEEALNTLNKKDLGEGLTGSCGQGPCVIVCSGSEGGSPGRQYSGCMYRAACGRSSAEPCLVPAHAGELKSLKKPPAGVDDIAAVVLCLLENVPKDRSWGAAGGPMGRLQQVLPFM